MEPRFTWQLREDAWYVRFYLWLWLASPRDVNFCKLFWAYVFVIPGLILHGLWAAAEWLSKIGAAGRERRALAKAKEENEPYVPPEPKGPNFMQRYLDWIGEVASKLVMKLTPNPATKRVLGIVGMALMVALGIAVIVVFFYFLIAWWSTTRWILLVAAVLLAAVLLGILTANLLERAGFFTWLEQRPPGNHRFFRGIASFFRGIGRGIKEFFHVMGLGFHAVKSNTCPKVEIVKEEP